MSDKSRFPVVDLVVVVVGIAALCAIGTCGHGETVTVHRDLGGDLASRLDDVAEKRASGTVVRVTGICASACTLYAGLPNTCTARGARWGFHGPASSIYGLALPQSTWEAASEQMAAVYPAPIRARFLAVWRHRVVGVEWVSGRDMIAMGVRECRENG